MKNSDREGPLRWVSLHLRDVVTDRFEDKGKFIKTVQHQSCLVGVIGVRLSNLSNKVRKKYKLRNLTMVRRNKPETGSCSDKELETILLDRFVNEK